MSGENSPSCVVRVQRCDETTVGIDEITTVTEITSSRLGPRNLLRHLTPLEPEEAKQRIRSSHA